MSAEPFLRDAMSSLETRPRTRLTFSKNCFNEMFTARECDACVAEGDRLEFMDCELNKTLVEPYLIAGHHIDVIVVDFISQTIKFINNSDDLKTNRVITLNFEIALNVASIGDEPRCDGLI